MKCNFHTHTARCNHAVGLDEEYVLSAIEAGFDEIGFSDHTPWPFESGYVSPMRMRADELEEYVLSVNRLREKYKDKIKIHLGLECEYFKDYIPWLCAMGEKYGIEYFLLGHHFSPDEEHGLYNGRIKTHAEIERYKNDVLEALESGLFFYVAHPDIFMRTYGEFDDYCEKASREIIAKAIETKTPLEYNLLGLTHCKEDGMKEGYPHSKFWHIAGEMGALAVVGIDAHDPKAFLETEKFEKARAMLESSGVKLVF